MNNSKIIKLNNQKYLVYLKEVAVRSNTEGKHAIKTRAFVKKLEG